MKLYSKIMLTMLGFFGVSQVSQAAVAAGITTALTDTGTDVATLGASVLIVIVAVAGVKYLRRVL